MEKKKDSCLYIQKNYTLYTLSSQEAETGGSRVQG